VTPFGWKYETASPNEKARFAVTPFGWKDEIASLPFFCHCEERSDEAVSSFWFLVASLWNPGGKRDGFSVDTTQRGGGV
jgi:hypothetical protein